VTWWDVLVLALAVLSPALALALSWTGARLARLFGARARDERTRAALALLDEAIFTIVREIQQVSADTLRAGSSDGKLGTGISSMLRRAALSRVREQLGARGIAELGRVLGLDQQALDRLIGTRIEAAVYELKRRQEWQSEAARRAG
jgi:hypothetical protein